MLRRLTAHKLPFSPFLRGKLRIFCYDFLNVAENRTMYQARHASRSNNSNWHFVFFCLGMEASIYLVSVPTNLPAETYCYEAVLSTHFIAH